MHDKLSAAIDGQDIVALKNALANTTDINQFIDEQHTALTKAIQCHWHEGVELLLQKKAHDEPNKHGFYASHIAAQQGEIAILQLLSNYAFELDHIPLSDDDIPQPLYLALDGGFDDCAVFLLSNGADFKRLVKKQGHYLNLAINKQCYQSAHYMLMHCPELINQQLGHENLLITLLDADPITHKQAERISFAKQLLQQFPTLASETNKQGCVAWHIAAAHGQVDMLELLKTYYHNKAIPNLNGQNALAIAMAHDQTDAIRWLLNNGLTLNSVPNALHLAISSNNHALKNSLIDNADLTSIFEQTDDDDNTPFDIAVSKNQLDLINQWLEQLGEKKSAFITSKRGQHVLIKAIITESLDALNILIQSGAKINCIIEGHTPLAYAIEHQAYDSMEVLLQSGASISDTDNNESLLKLCITNEDATAFEKLLQAGADADSIKDDVKQSHSNSSEINRIKSLLGIEIVDTTTNNLDDLLKEFSESLSNDDKKQKENDEGSDSNLDTLFEQLAKDDNHDIDTSSDRPAKNSDTESNTVADIKDVDDIDELFKQLSDTKPETIVGTSHPKPPNSILQDKIDTELDDIFDALTQSDQTKTPPDTTDNNLDELFKSLSESEK